MTNVQKKINTVIKILCKMFSISEQEFFLFLYFISTSSKQNLKKEKEQQEKKNAKQKSLVEKILNFFYDLNS